MASEAIVARLKAVLSGDSSQLRADLGKAESSLKNFSDKATKTGRTLTTRVTLPMVGLGVAAVKTATDFESSMTKITALVGVARSEVDRMSGSVRGMATQFGKSANEAADALFYITSAGLRGATATDTLAASLKASAIGLGETSTIADLATSALNAYGADVLSAAQATDVMTATIREGKLETTELAGSMGRVLPLASAMGVNFNEVGAAFAALSRTGTNAAEAATQIRGILASLLRPTKQAEEALTEMGLSSEGLRTQLREEGLLATLKTLSEEFAGNEAAAASVFGNIRALSGVLDLMGANVATTEAIFANMTDTTGAVDDAFAEVSQTTAFQFAQAMAEMKELLLSLGQELLPTVNSALQTVSDGIRSTTAFFGDMDESTQDIVKALGGIVAVAGPVALGVGAISKAFLALKAANPWVLALTGALTGLGVVFGNYLSNAREARERQESLTEAFREANDPATTVVDRLSEIAASMSKISEVEPEAETDFSEFMAGIVLDAEFAQNGVTAAFRSLSSDSTAAIEAFVDSGRQAFPLFTQEAYDAQGVMENILDTALYGEGPLQAFAEALYTNGEFANFTYEEMLGLLDAIDDTSKAQDDHRRSVEETNKEYVTSGQIYKDFNSVLGEATVAAFVAAAESSGNYTEALIDLYGRAERTAAITDYLNAIYGDHEAIVSDLSDTTAAATSDAEALARSLVEAGNMAGYEAGQITQVIRQLGILDDLPKEVQVELGLQVTGVAQVIAMIDGLIASQREAIFAAGGREVDVIGAIGPLIRLKDALRASLDPEETDKGGRSPASNAMDELARAEEEAAREAERLQREIDRVAERIADLGSEIVGKDFFEFMLGASADEIEDRFYDIGQAAMGLVDQAEALGLAGGPEFLQTLANIGVEFDRLAALQAQVASTQSAIADAEAELTTATNDLAAAQANLNRENERYAEFLYGEGRGGGTFEQVLKTEIDAYRDLQRELAGVEQEQTGFRKRILDMMSPTVAGAAGAGGVMGNLGNILAQARTFRNNLIELRDRGYPTDVIGQVVAAGMTQGNIISRRLLALGTSEFEDFLALRDEISRIGVETAAIAGEVIFGADIASAEGAVREQFGVVDRMFQSAIAQAAENVRQQEAVVDGLRAALGALETRLADLRAGIETLAADIQSAMRSAFDQFLAGLNAAISRLPEVRNLPAPTSTGGGAAPAPARPTAPSPAPAPAAPAAGAYAVARGDSLWAIAERTLGSGARWREIQQANNISGTLIHPGQQLTIPARAAGGPVTRGRPYLVGEMGPELFVPSQSGGILSNRATAQVGAGTVNYNISVTANGDPAEAGRQIVKAIQEYERRNGNRWRSS